MLFRDHLVAYDEGLEVAYCKINPKSTLLCRQWIKGRVVWYRGTLIVRTPSGAEQFRVTFDKLFVLSEKWKNAISMIDDVNDLMEVKV